MKISMEWLRQYVDFNEGPERLDEIITQVGFEVEDVQQVGDDWALDLDVTSNRPDCLGHIGVAREVAAVTGAAFHLPDVTLTEQGKDVAEWTSVTDEAPDLCGRYTARVIDGVQVGPSPDWMVRRLETVGIRSISNVVDVTNYVMMEVGQPLHSFDYACLGQGRIVVRRARVGEKMELIDHSQIELAENMLVIADADVPVALAGVMGGAASEVGAETKTVLLESAHFDPLSIRGTSRALTAASESSFRFERNIDIVTVEWASRRATSLLAELAGGQVAPGLVDVWPGAWHGCEVTMRLSRLSKLLGIQLDDQLVLDILGRLGYQPRLADGVVICTQPSWRRDITREVDLIEEVIRIHGYDKIPTEKNINITVKSPDAFQRTRAKATSALNGCGFFETVNVGFMEDRYAELFLKEGSQPVRVDPFTRKTNNALRYSVLPSLMAARQRNKDAGNERCDLYELAAVHEPSDNGSLPRETMMLGVLTDGDFRELRGVIEALVAGVDRQATVECDPGDVLWAGPGEGAHVKVASLVIGQMGRAGKSMLAAFDLEQDVCLAEIHFDALVSLEGAQVTLQPLGRFPAIERDLSLVLAEAVSWREIESLILQQNISDMQSIEFVDVFRGKGIEKGKKSLTLSMLFRRHDGTLTNEQVDEYIATVLKAMEESFAATLRA